MKIINKLLFLSTIIFLAVACKKDDGNETKDNTSLIGKWQLTESYADSGNGKENWVPVPKSPEQSVQFKADGGLEGTYFSDYSNYVIKDSVSITFKKTGKPSQDYSYRIKDGKLSMSPSGPIVCIEGCGIRFTKL